MLKHRETKQRRIVLETVRSHTDHPTANTICEGFMQLTEKSVRVPYTAI